jgi:hypothetical protein
VSCSWGSSATARWEVSGPIGAALVGRLKRWLEGHARLGVRGMDAAGQPAGWSAGVSDCLARVCPATCTTKWGRKREADMARASAWVQQCLLG